MTDTPEIKFVRVVRECGHNDNLRPGEKIIYDFDVIVDGVNLATWKRNIYKRGYYLSDSGGREVKAPWFDASNIRRVEDPAHRWHGVQAENKEQFAEVVIRELDYIPTPAQVEQRRLDEEAANGQAERARLEAHRTDRIKQAGPDLLAALEKIAEVCNGYDLEAGWAGQFARAAIAKATGDQT